MRRLWLLLVVTFALGVAPVQASTGSGGNGTPLPVPAPEPMPVLSRLPDVVIQVQVTHYWPPNGGENCLVYMDDWCVSPTASGVPWEAVIGIAAACPMEWPLGSVVIIGDRAWVCLDRGTMRCENDACEVDLLTPSAAMDGIHAAAVYFPFLAYRGPYEP